MRALRIMAMMLPLAAVNPVPAKEKTVEPPDLVSAPAPEYPAELLAAQVEGAIEVSFAIDGEGATKKVKAAHWTDERFKSPCVEAVEKWIFKPRKSKGGELDRLWFSTIEFMDGRVAVGKVRDRSEVRIPPVVVKQVAPTYPPSLRNVGNVGKVVLTFIVDRQGNVREPEVVTATHPAFEAPAVAAILKWKFTPGTHGGRPVSTRVQQQVSFYLSGGPTAEAFAMEKNRKAKVPEALKVDVLPKPKVTVFVVHPYEHAVAGTKGTAEVRVLVGLDGMVLDTLIIEASRPEFGLALAASMEAWEFEPALRDGKPTLAVINRKHEFAVRDRDSAIDGETAALAAQIRQEKFTPARARELDAGLRPTFDVPPVYPTVFLERGVAGSAKIEVIVDTKGRAVLPRIVEASEPEFGWAAATAAQRWRFDPPKVKGKPVEVRVMIPFKFTPPEPGAEGNETPK